MNRNSTIFLFSFVIAALGMASGYNGPVRAASNGMVKITSSAFSEGGDIPVKYTCDGSNASPELSISEVPSNTESLFLVADDPDAPAGNFNHWIIWNIAPDTKNISENKLPAGAVSGKNSSGKNGYMGPCPPSGTHRYIFKIYALDVKLDMSENSSKEDLEKAMARHIIGQGQLTGKYRRE